MVKSNAKKSEFVNNLYCYCGFLDLISSCRIEVDRDKFPTSEGEHCEEKELRQDSEKTRQLVPDVFTLDNAVRQLRLGQHLPAEVCKREKEGL